MKKLIYPDIIKLIDIYETKEKRYLVLEYALGGDMYEYLKEHGKMDEAKAREKFIQLISIFQYCHRNDVVHR